MQQISLKIRNFQWICDAHAFSYCSIICLILMGDSELPSKTMCNSPFYFLIIRINIPLHRCGGSHGLHLQLRFAVVGVLALIEGAGHGDPRVRGKSVGLRPLADEAAGCKVGGTAGHNQPRGNELVCVHLAAGFIHLARSRSVSSRHSRQDLPKSRPSMYKTRHRRW